MVLLPKPNFFQEGRADFEGCLLLSDLNGKEVLDDIFDALQLLISVVRELANDGDYESSHCRDEKLHFFAPVAEIAKN